LGGYSTLLLDVMKAILPGLYVKINHPELIYIASLCAFLGHVFPIWLKFKGGKGVATYVGIWFTINILLGFIFCVTWLLIFLISKYCSLSSLMGSLTIPVYMGGNDQMSNALRRGIMCGSIYDTHRENMKGLKNKEESKKKMK
jgi:Predicted membrane protein